MQDLNAKALEPTTLPKNIIKWWQWYNHLTGLDTVEISKRQVIDLQNKLFECQDKRKVLNKNITDITHILQHIYGELIQTKRDDPKYVNLTIMENKNLQEQKIVLDQLALLEKEERDNFIQLATAIKEYHDSQNLNAQRYKYLSILASAIIAIVSLIVSLVSIMLNNNRILNIRNTIKETQEKNQALLQTNVNQLSNLANMMQSIENKLSQKLSANKDKKKEDSLDMQINPAHVTPNMSNIILKSAIYPVHLLTSGIDYMKKGIYVCGSYVVKIFY